jgi:hypothetical protein
MLRAAVAVSNPKPKYLAFLEKGGMISGTEQNKKTGAAHLPLRMEKAFIR